MLKILVKVTQFVNKTFALWVIVFGILGFFFPEIFKKVAPWIPPLLGVVMFGMGMTLTPGDFREVLRRPRDVLIGVAAQFVIMPVSAYLLCIVMHLPPEVAVGMMLLGCCPGGTASNVVCFLARGDVALSVTVTSCTTLLAPIMTPSLMYLFASQWMPISAWAMFISIVKIILIPVTAGVIINKYFGKYLNNVMATLPLISVGAIVTIVAAVTAASGNQLLQTGPVIFAAVLIQNLIGMACGYGAGKLFGLELAKRKTLCFEVGMQNSGLGVALATVHFAASPLTALPSALGALLHNITGPAVASVMQGWHEEGEKETFFDKMAKATAAAKAGTKAGTHTAE
ncbi:MAG: Bile acid transporter [Burkholderia sp.]|jgi:bile acid:Na+ symporter, BASS family